MRRSRAIAAGVLCILLTGCANSISRKPDTYVVKRDDTLYGIAWRHNLDYRDVAKWNDLRPDFRLSVGQILVLKPPRRRNAASAAEAAPKTAPEPQAATAPPARKPRVPADASTRASAAPAVPSAPLPRPPILPAGADAWGWPTDRKGPPRPVPGGGILLLGTLGQDVRATANGRVVYTGSGLRGYGNLIIIKHGESLLSSYAHNQEMLVREGQEVRAGQVIAHMGTGPHQIAALYFEIRVNGKPVDPVTYLRDIK